MKFRDKSSRYMTGSWESHYLPYQRLKASLRVIQHHGHGSFAELYFSLGQAIITNTAFTLQCQSVLQHDEEQLKKQCNEDSLAVPRFNLTYLSVTSLHEALLELVWFYRVNYEAMSRIYVKLAQAGHLNGPDLEHCRGITCRHLEEYLQAYNKCADQLNRVQARLARYQGNQLTRHAASHDLDQDCKVVAAIFLNGSDEMLGVWNRRGQNPLHFGATHGMINFCMHLLSEASLVEEYLSHRDELGFTPLHISVTQGHVEITQLLLSAIDKHHLSIPDDLLYIALRREDDAMVKLLVTRSLGLRHKSSSGESCLYVAAQLGRDDYLRLLLPISDSDLIDASEDACHWSPLFIGCVKGHASTVKLLIDAGANKTRRDYREWTAQENACFRGHLAVAELFTATSTKEELSLPLLNSSSRRENVTSFNVRPGLAHVILNLGGLQETQLQDSALDLSETDCHGFRLVISTSESVAPIERMIPLLDDPVDDTFVFAVNSSEGISIRFNIHKCEPQSDEYGALVGAGVAFLPTRTTSFGAQHGTLLREQSVPILYKDTMRLLGTVTFSYLIVKPYSQLSCPSPTIESFKTTGSIQLVGHRGLGQNSRGRFLQLGENTIESFLAADIQGANYVELMVSQFGKYNHYYYRCYKYLRRVDVQITRDLVPVLFHDYSLSESGTDIPIHDVTLNQFMYASNIQSPRGNPPSIIESSKSLASHDYNHLHRPRSRSVAIAYEKGAEQVNNRMMYTVDYMNKGFKPNTRGTFIQDTFATLENVLCNLPERIGFDMEIKYPRVHEALDAGIAPVSVDINTFVDTILDLIARYGGNRNIVLSSFTPDICILLAIKQQSYPVLFISNAGKRPISDKDKRAGSLQMAVRFAKNWGLAGIVVAADSLVMCPRLIGFIKSQGLICGTYNDLNNEPANVELQARAGIDVIVADRVGLISQTLKRTDA